MKKITVYGITYEAEKIIKTDADVIGYIGDKESFSFRGVNDFSQFVFDAGETFDKTEIEIIRETLDALVLASLEG